MTFVTDMALIDILNTLEKIDISKSEKALLDDAKALTEDLFELYQSEGIYNASGTLDYNLYDKFIRSSPNQSEIYDHPSITTQTIHKIQHLADILGNNSKTNFILGIGNIVTEAQYKKIAENKGDNIKNVIRDYHNHLCQKMEKNFGDDYSNNFKYAPIPGVNPENYSQAQIDLITRYVTIRDAHHHIEKKGVDVDAVDKAKYALSQCLEKKPDVSERTFLQKLTSYLQESIKKLFQVFLPQKQTPEKTLNERLEEATSLESSTRFNKF